MQITLDEEQWQLPDETSLMEVLAAISDKAQAKQRIVTSLTIGGQGVTDRDLVPAFLNQAAQGMGPIAAASKSLHTIISEARQAISRFAVQLQSDGRVLLAPLRSGTGHISSIDAWLGRLADYTEMAEAGHKQGVAGLSSEALLPWIQELLAARTSLDPVRVADLLEYELLPRLIEATEAA
jgi:hypothetical protein